MARRLTADMLGESVKRRLLSAVVVNHDTDCWIWIAGKNQSGYGVIRITVNGRSWAERCHRAAYALFRGAVPSEMNVLHKCDVRACCNPDHLFLGTAQDNTDDMHAKNRWVRPSVHRGAKSATSKLTDAQVEEIITQLLSGRTRTAIAIDFGMTMAAISKIATGKNWRHLTQGRGIVKSTRGVKRGNR